MESSMPQSVTSLSSSPAVIQSPQDTDDAKDSTFAFLVHSQATLTQHLPPDVDNKSLARQRRKRTSPEDQAVLESEYQKNHKPDKATRMEIVRRVALGEKEVQIWFQNRRQTTRRKSKPLGPDELASLRSTHTTADLNNHVPSSVEEASVPDLMFSAPSLTRNPAYIQHETCSDSDSLEQSRLGPSSLDPIRVGRLSSPENGSGSSPVLIDSNLRTQNLNTTPPHMSLDSKRVNETFTFSKPIQSSDVRISLSLEGKAQIIAGNIISPPKKRPAHPEEKRRPLQRSQSAIISRGLSKAGRSYDARTWEFYCDSESQNSLATNAKREQLGSAAGAIGLMRSRSGNNILHSNSFKRNAQAGLESSSKRLKVDAEAKVKPKLCRTSSSTASLPSQTQRSSTAKSKDERTVLEASNDGSDKENWLPGTRSAPKKGQRLATARPVLKDNLGMVTDGAEITLSVSKRANVKRQKPSNNGLVAIFDENSIESNAAEGEDEIQEFMSSAKGKEDFDCVQQLLSLSQGNWQ